MEDIPSPEDVLAVLRPYIPNIYNAFEAGVDHALEYDEVNGFELNPHLYAHHVRHFVRVRLTQPPLRIQDYEPENLANSGLQFSIGDYTFRVFKANKLEVPDPRRSKALLSFYQQNRTPTLPGMKGWNILILWHASPSGEFQDLSLAFPLASAPDNWKWYESIPHPAISRPTITVNKPSFDEFEQDLPYERNDGNSNGSEDQSEPDLPFNIK